MNAAVTNPIDARFWDRIAPRYAKKPVPDETAYRQTLDRTRAHLSMGDRGLEVGCGTGTTALHLAPHLGELIATDVSEGMIAIAREKRKTAGHDNVRFETGTLEASYLEVGSFDVVMAFNLVHLLEDIPGSIARVRSLLKPGGLFISKTACLGRKKWLLRPVIGVIQLVGKAPFVNFVKTDELQSLMVEAGFSIVETGFYPEKSDNHFIVARRTEV